jgi:hypothetical protein
VASSIEDRVCGDVAESRSGESQRGKCTMSEIEQRDGGVPPSENASLAATVQALLAQNQTLMEQLLSQRGRSVRRETKGNLSLEDLSDEEGGCD